MRTSLKIDTYTHSAELLGDPKGDKVLLLHGFPVTYRMWLPLQESLAEDGFQSLAPELLGYGNLCRPREVESYGLLKLVANVISIADEMKWNQFHLVGHDWGSVLGWAVAARFSDRIKSFTALSVPHPEALSEAINKDEQQKEASGYMASFQELNKPEKALTENGFSLLKSLWTHSSQEEKENYLSCFQQEGALTAAINWYRANYNSLVDGSLLKDIVSVPVHFIWGRRDSAIREGAAKRCHKFAVGRYKETLLDGGHWLVEEFFQEMCRIVKETISEIA